MPQGPIAGTGLARENRCVVLSGLAENETYPKDRCRKHAHALAWQVTP